MSAVAKLDVQWACAVGPCFADPVVAVCLCVRVFAKYYSLTLVLGVQSMAAWRLLAAPFPLWASPGASKTLHAEAFRTNARPLARRSQISPSPLCLHRDIGLLFSFLLIPSSSSCLPILRDCAFLLSIAGTVSFLPCIAGIGFVSH